MTDEKLNLVMVGAFPPPVHGLAAVNAAVEVALSELGAAPVVINVAAKGLQRSFFARLGRGPKVLSGLFRFMRMKNLKGATLYMSVSGGAGQFYEILFLVIARRRAMRIFLHHHSYAYLGRLRNITNWLIGVAGADALHVALSPGMEERLRGLYAVKRTTVVSNAAIFLADGKSIAKQDRSLRTLGFLGNIAAEKGVFEYLNLLRFLRDRGVPIKAKLAGPFQDEATEIKVREQLLSLPDVEYVGAKYGAEKDHFFSDIDALIFPTLYGNEAEPLTLYEAMFYRNPVIAYGRGAIGEIVGANCGCVIDPGKPFVPEALEQIDRWLRDQAAFHSASISAEQRCKKIYIENRERWHELLCDISGVRRNMLSETFLAEKR